jgi:hypothetical protein
MPATTHITWNQNDVFLTTGCLVGKWPQICCDPQDADAIGINKSQNNIVAGWRGKDFTIMPLQLLFIFFFQMEL